MRETKEALGRPMPDAYSKGSFNLIATVSQM